MFRVLCGWRISFLPTALSPELQQIVRAQGSNPVENPGGGVAFYAYRDDHPNLVPLFTANEVAVFELP